MDYLNYSYAQNGREAKARELIGRMAEATGDNTGAQTYFVKLTEECPPSADRPELAEMKAVQARKLPQGNADWVRPVEWGSQKGAI